MNPEYDAQLIAEGVPNVTLPAVETAKEAVTGTGFLGGLSGVLSPVAAGLGLASGLTNVFGGGGSVPSSDISEATGYLYGGSFNPLIIGGKSNTVIIVLIVVVAFLLLRKK